MCNIILDILYSISYYYIYMAKHDLKDTDEQLEILEYIQLLQSYF